MEATDKHQFLKDNKYILLDLYEIEELMVKSGYITPEEAYSVNSEKTYGLRMNRAADIFYEYISEHAPEMMSE